MVLSPDINIARRTLLLDFRRYLIHAWPNRPSWEYGYWQDMCADVEWIIAHWEIMVEDPLRKRVGEPFYLETYSQIGDEESRVYENGEYPTHAIFVNGESYYFDSFTSREEGLEIPTFDQVLCERSPDYYRMVVALEDATFSLGHSDWLGD